MDKKKSSTATTSIDEKHNEMMTMYHVIENETIPKVQSEIKEMISDARKIKNKKSESYYEMVDKIKEKKRELKQLQQSKNDYLLHNAKYIFHYYEEKQKINLGENVKDKKSRGEELSFEDFETMARGGEKTQKQVQFLCPKMNHLSVDEKFSMRTPKVTKKFRFLYNKGVVHDDGTITSFYN